MQKMNFTASEIYSWIYSLSKEMTGLDVHSIRMRCLVYEQALTNHTNGKVPFIDTIDDEFRCMDRFNRNEVLDAFVLHLGTIDNEFPILSQCISELFRVNSKIALGEV